MRRLERRDDGYDLFEVQSVDEIDFRLFAPMADAAWKHDYVDEVRLDFGEPVLRKLLRGSSWVAVLVCGRDGSPVGFELALERQLRVRERSLSTYYASAFTVAVEHRRRGLGRWILEGINRLVFEERCAQLMVSTFHAGHAGSPTVQSTFDRIAGWGVRAVHETGLFSLRFDGAAVLDGQALERPSEPLAFARVALRPDESGGETRLEVVDGVAGEVPSLVELNRRVGREFDLSFAFSASLNSQYLNAEDDASGLLLFDLGEGRLCLLGYNVVPISINDRQLRPLGQLQFVLAPDCSEDELTAAVLQLARLLADRGCLALSVLDLGMVPMSVLSRLGFEPTPGTITFAARGPQSTLDLFSSARPPFFVDFT